MPVDAQLQTLLDAMRAADFPSFGALSAAEMRARPQPPLIVMDPVKSVRDSEIAGPAGALPVRIYRPADVTNGLIVYFHGGGWTFGYLDSVDAAVRAIVHATQYTAISVDYRLAPEQPFPAAVDDAIASMAWAASHSQELTGRKAAPLILMGDSAGGNLAAVAAQHARDADGPAIALQVLIYPSTEGYDTVTNDLACQPPFLNQNEMAWLMDQYVQPAQRRDIRFAPGKAENFADLPPAIILTAEYDLLTPEGLAYGEKLRAAKCDVTSLHYPGAIHGFVTMAPFFEIGRKAIRDMAQEILHRLGTALPYP